MSTIISEVINSQSFGVLVERVNQIADTITSNVVTTAYNDAGAIDGIGQTIGNAFVQGILGSNIIYATTVAGGNISSNTFITIASNTNLYWSNSTSSGGYLSVGNSTVNSSFTVNSTTNTIASFNGFVGSTLQVSIKNSNTGPYSSAKFAAYNDVGKQISMGIKGSQWSDPTFTINGGNSGYLYTNSSLSIGVIDDTSRISFFVGGTESVNEILTIANSGNVGINSTNPDSNFTVTGTANVSANLYVGGYTTIANSLNVASIDCNLIPTGNNTWNIGNNTHRFHSLYISGSTIYLGNVAVSQAIDGVSVEMSNLLVDINSVVGGNSSVLNNLNVSNVTTLSNTLSVVNSTTLSNTLLVQGNSTFNNTMSIVGATSLGNTLSVVNSTSLSNTLIVTGNSTFSNSVIVVGNSTFNNTMLIVGATTLQNTLSVTNSTSLANTLIVTGNSTFSNAVIIVGNSALQNTLTVSGATSLGNTLSVVNSVTMANTLAVTGATTLSNSVVVVGNSTFSNTISVTGNSTLSNTLSVTGAVIMGNTLSVTNSVIMSNTLNVTGSVGFSNTLSVTGSVILSNTLSVTNSVTISNTVAITGDTRINSSNFWLYSNTGNYSTVGNTSQNTVTNSSSISVSNVFATNIAGLITTVNQTQIIANNSLNLDGQRGSYYIGLSTAAYNNALSNAIALSTAAYVNAVAYTDNKAAADLAAAKSYADGVACTTLVAAKTYASNATNITSGTFPGTVLSGSYAGITNVGTLSSNLTVTNAITANQILTTNAVSFGNSASIAGNTFIGGSANIVMTMGVGGNANVGGDFRVAGDLYVTGTTRSTGTSSVAGDLVPLSNSYNLGDIAHRFTLYGMGANFVNPLVVSNTVTFGNTFPSANGILLGNNTLRWALSANTIDVSSVGTFANLTSTSNTSLQKTTIATANVVGVFTAQGNTILQSNASITGQLSVTNTVSFGNTTILGTSITLNGNYIYSNKYTVTAGIGVQTFDSFDPTAFRSAEYIIQVSNATHASVSKLLVFHNNGDSYVTEYAQLNNPSILGTFSSDIGAGAVRLKFTPLNNSITPSISFVRTTLAL